MVILQMSSSTTLGEVGAMISEDKVVVDLDAGRGGSSEYSDVLVPLAEADDDRSGVGVVVAVDPGRSGSSEYSAGLVRLAEAGDDRSGGGDGDDRNRGRQDHAAEYAIGAAVHDAGSRCTSQASQEAIDRRPENDLESGGRDSGGADTGVDVNGGGDAGAGAGDGGGDAGGGAGDGGDHSKTTGDSLLLREGVRYVGTIKWFDVSKGRAALGCGIVSERSNLSQHLALSWWIDSWTLQMD
jgi:hypothetical protein